MKGFNYFIVVAWWLVMGDPIVSWSFNKNLGGWRIETYRGFYTRRKLRLAIFDAYDTYYFVMTDRPIEWFGMGR